mgnify:CR=1 FL=1|tara:strand:- start:108 stop:926 length:819 start_codon:yes stop_codon:yes gene_type:complete
MKTKRTKIIADLTSNHLGDMEVIEAMIHCLSEHKIDFIKIQSWRADMLRKDYPDYQSNYNYYEKHQLSDDDHYRVLELCKKYEIQFLTTCFNINRIDFLSSLGINTIKVASSDFGSYRMISKLLDKFESLIISAGASTKEELEKTIDLCKGRDVTFLHCVSTYPCPLNEVNMERMLYLRERGLKVGYSDHTLGTEASKYAICLGAKYVEKHFTLNRYLPGRDQKMSSTIDEMSELLEWSHLVNSMRGSEEPELSASQLTFRKNYIAKWGNNQ